MTTLHLPPPNPRLDQFGWHGHARVNKYWADDDLTRATPYEVVEAENLLLTLGAGVVLDRLNGVSVNPLDLTNGRMCVGDSTTAAAIGQTDLQASTNKIRQVFDAAPTRSGNVAQYVSTFAAGVGTFTWNEAGLANGAAGVLVSRFVQSFGAKGAGTQWVLTVSVTLT